MVFGCCLYSGDIRKGVGSRVLEKGMDLQGPDHSLHGQKHGHCYQATEDEL